MNKIKCSICGKEYSKYGIKNHVNITHLKSRPATGQGRIAWNKGLTKETDERVKKYGETNSLKIKEGITKPSLLGKKHKQESIEKMKLNCGGYRENAGHSKKFKVIDSFGKEITLQSTFELKCSKLLNQMNIKWVRPKALKYDGRNYFADFYLVEYNIWLDPKNDYKAIQDREKIEKVIKQNNVKVYIILENQINEEYIASLIQ